MTEQQLFFQTFQKGFKLPDDPLSSASTRIWSLAGMRHLTNMQLFSQGTIATNGGTLNKL
jgi:hypothetical protein